MVGGVKGIDVAPYRSLARRRLQRPRSPLPGARHPAVNVPLTVAVPTPRTKHTLTRVRRYPLTTLHVVSTQIVFIPRLSAVSDDNYSSSSTPSPSSAVGGRISVLRYAYSSCVLSLSRSLARSLSCRLSFSKHHLKERRRHHNSRRRVYLYHLRTQVSVLLFTVYVHCCLSLSYIYRV